VSRRDQIRMTDDEVHAFLQERHTLQVATIGPSGRIHLVAMWYGFLDGDIAFWTYGRSQKVLNLQRDPRMTCLIEEGDVYEQLVGVEMAGTGEVIEDRETVYKVGESVMDRHSGPYTPEMRPIVESVGAKRVAIRLRVEQLVSWDHRKLGGRY
jgi:PPOX class probable F420-dependent enzyme